MCFVHVQKRAATTSSSSSMTAVSKRQTAARERREAMRSQLREMAAKRAEQQGEGEEGREETQEIEATVVHVHMYVPMLYSVLSVFVCTCVRVSQVSIESMAEQSCCRRACMQHRQHFSTLVYDEQNLYLTGLMIRKETKKSVGHKRK